VEEGGGAREEGGREGRGWFWEGVRMNPVFNHRSIGSLIVFSAISGLAISWLLLDVVPWIFITPFQITSLPYLTTLFFRILITYLVLFAVLHNSMDIVSKGTRGVVRRV